MPDYKAAATDEVTDREKRLQAALAAVQAELQSTQGAEVALQHFEVVQEMVSRRAHSPFSRCATPPTALKTFASVPVRIAISFIFEASQTSKWMS